MHIGFATDIVDEVIRILTLALTDGEHAIIETYMKYAQKTTLFEFRPLDRQEHDQLPYETKVNRLILLAQLLCCRWLLGRSESLGISCILPLKN